MSIANDKALNLAGAKILYDDLRGRVEEKTSHKDVHDFVYSGIEEYTPGTTKTFYKGTFYHEVGSSYVCTPNVESLEIVVEAGSPEADWEHLPTTPGTGFLWAVYTLNGYIEARIASLDMAQVLAIVPETRTSSDMVLFTKSYPKGTIFKYGENFYEAVNPIKSADYLLEDSWYTKKTSTTEMLTKSWTYLKENENSYIHQDGFAYDTGLILVKTSGFSNDKRLREVYSAAEADHVMQTYGFATSSNERIAVNKFFGQNPKPKRLLISCYPASQNPSEALDSVMEITTDFYGVMCASTETDSKTLSLAQKIAGMTKPCVLFIPLIGTVATITQSGSLLDTLKTASRARALATHVNSIGDCGGIMGCAIGSNLTHIYGNAKRLEYQVPIGLTEVDSGDGVDIKNMRGNVWTPTNGIDPAKLTDNTYYYNLVANDMKNKPIYFNKIKIGDTTITEAQLQALLATLN